MNEPAAHNPDSVASPGAPARPKGRWMMVALSLLVTGAVLTWLARQNQGFALHQFLDLLRAANLPLLATALLAAVTAFAVRALRWADLVRPYAPQARLLDLFGNTVIGFAAVLVLGRPAELLRPYLISRQLGVPFPSQVGAWLLERIYDLLVVLAVAAWALSTLNLDSLPVGSPLAIALRAGGFIVLTAAVVATALLLVFTFAQGFAIDRLRPALALLPASRQEGANRLLSAFLDALAVSRRPALFARIVGYSLLHFAVVALSTWLVFLALPASAHLSLPATLRFLALQALASAVPLPGLVGGYFVITALLLTEWLGMPLETASAITLAFAAIQTASTLLPAALATLRSGLNWRKIKNMEREAQL